MHDETKIEMKIQEEIKPLEDACKKIAEEFSLSINNAEKKHLPEASAITDMIKDLCEAKEKIVKACYYKYILGTMEKSEEEDKEEEKYFLRMMKEERGDELKRMQEEFGEDEGERRFYDNYRYKSSGRFAPRGRGSYMPRSSGRRRGYEEMPYIMSPEMYEMHPAEYYRDVDRSAGRLYYSGSGSSSGSYGGNSGSSYNGNSGSMNGGQSGNSGGGSTRGYEDGYNDGERRGYESGYREGERSGRRNSQGSQSRYERAKRGYEEAKQAHKGNSPEDKKLTMEETEKMINVVFDEIDEMLEDASPEMKNMVKTKGLSRFQKIS